MSAATSPSDSTLGQRVAAAAPWPAVAGAAEIGFVHRAGRTRLAHLYQRDPLRVLFPDGAAGDVPCAALVTTSGGLVGGDRHDVRVDVGAGAAAMVAGQAAEKVYRSAGDDCRIDVRLDIAAGGWLEWLPQETIVFQGARLRRRTAIALAPGARSLAGEILVFGRIARGERLTEGLVREAWEIRRRGRLVWADALHLEGAPGGDLAAILDEPAGFDGARALATLVCLVDDAAARLAGVRARLAAFAADLRAAATVVEGVLIARWLGRDAGAVRRAFAGLWVALRHDLAGLPPLLPRLWSV